MAKPPRSPLLGYNHNVKYRGRIFHVQTEDSGPANPRLFTHLYFEGSILASKRHEYDPGAADDIVRGLMQGQHKAILKDLRQGLLDEKLVSFFARRGEEVTLAEGAEALETVEAVPAAVPPPVVDQLSGPIDLDSLPLAIAETAPPERGPALLPASGPGVYVMRKSGEGLAPDHRSGVSLPATPQPVMPRAAIPPATASSDALMPVVVFDPTPSAATPPPIPRAAVVPQPARFLGGAAPTPRPAVNSGVVVQRQVPIGAAGATPPPLNVPARPPVTRARRPAPSIPYVVKEGSHVPAAPSRSAYIPPPRPMVPPPTTSANAARTAAVLSQATQPEAASDRSLDEVILSYLSNSDAKE